MWTDLQIQRVRMLAHGIAESGSLKGIGARDDPGGSGLTLDAHWLVNEAIPDMLVFVTQLKQFLRDA